MTFFKTKNLEYLAGSFDLKKNILSNISKETKFVKHNL